MCPQSGFEARVPVGQALPGRTAVLVNGWHVDEILFAETPLGLAVGGLRLGHDRANARLLTGENLFALKVPPVSNHAEVCAPQSAAGLFGH